MSFPTAAGVASYSGTMIPQLWSPKFLIKFYANTALSEIANNDYEGDIKKYGDKVTIATLPDITTFTYTKGMVLPQETPDPGKVEMYIDKGIGFNIAINSVDVKQSIVPFVDRFVEDGVKQTKIAIERDVYANIYADADTYNKGTTAGKISGNINLGTTGSAVEIDKTNAVEVIIRCSQALDEQNVPEEDRWIMLPAWYSALLKESDLKAAFLTGDAKSVIRTGKLGMIDRFMVYGSNLLYVPTGTGSTHVLAGHKSALTFVTQLVENEVVTNPADYGKLHRALQVYGYKVTKAVSLVDLYCKPAS